MDKDWNEKYLAWCKVYGIDISPDTRIEYLKMQQINAHHHQLVEQKEKQHHKMMEHMTMLHRRR